MGFLLCALLLAKLGTGQAHGQAREHVLKAAFLYNFSQFVEWPADAFPESDAPFIIGVLGADNVAESLREIVVDQKVKQHPFVIRHYQRPSQVRPCHILFIGQEEDSSLYTLQQRLKAHPVLTVGEGEGFCLRGGMIRFLVAENRIRLRINPAAAKAARLTISSKLLRLAEIVPTE